MTIIISTWNNSKTLELCLQRLASQTNAKIRVYIIDNGSSDKSLQGLERKSESMEIEIQKLKNNIGYAAANNIGAGLAYGKWIAFLNADAFPEADWLENLLRVAEHNPNFSSFTSRQIQFNKTNLLDGAGDSYHITGLAWRQYYNRAIQDFGQKTEEVFSACPTAALYSREAFLKAGGFDEDYFSYFEDVDLGFRLRLMGEKCLYVPEAVVYHVGSASTGKRSDFSVYYGYRNMIWTFVKNMPFPYFWLFLPLHISAILFFAIYLTLRGQGKVIWKAIFDAIIGLPKMIEKRKVIQKNIKIKPKDLLKVMSTGLFEPLQEFIHRNKGHEK